MNELIFANGNITPNFFYEQEAYSGVVKIADKVRNDIYLVCGNKPDCVDVRDGICLENNHDMPAVIFGTLHHSKLLERLIEEKKIDVKEVEGKNEVYGFSIVEQPLPEVPWAIVIAGSDKRGTIYGLFHISELLEVSPFVNWSNVQPPKKMQIVFKKEDSMISKEPSVYYRGFFINDEWPSFGTWCEKHFGGINAKMYEHIFEVLLRLKGNYMWPAMWSGCFAQDGPGLKSANLADEYGIVMGLSHHEPCLRHGEEYSHVRGKDSIYGDAWNFHTNTEGITRFWRDGLKRNGHLENVITIGMRGERDSAIMGDNATLEDNINLLRDVIRAQHSLIQEEVNEDLSKVPRMLALYKEVEPYFYGDATTKGLMHDQELEDVIFLLCDDNHGYLRTRPFGDMKKHKGGYGMYYHFDYHGDPVSFEWVNSTYLPVVWEQMTQAYETGISKLWIVNVGDFAFNEYPLSYFMDLAYDYERYGVEHVNETTLYTRNWAKLQFGREFDEEQLDLLTKVIVESSRLVHNRRPEHMHEDVYKVCADCEAWNVLEQAKELMEQCDNLLQACGQANRAAFYELVYYNVYGALNLVCMWIYRSLNHFFAGKGAIVANDYGDLMLACMEKDKALRDTFHGLLDGKWDGFALAPHIGFVNWNCEEARNPIYERVFPIGDARIMVGVCGCKESTTGEEWTWKKLTVSDFLHCGKKQARIYLATMQEKPQPYKVVCDAKWLKISPVNGVIDKDEAIHFVTLTIDEDAYQDSSVALSDAVIYVKYANADVEIAVKAPKRLEQAKNSVPVYIEADGVVCIHADHFCEKKDAKDGAGFVVLKHQGKNSSAIRTFPITESFYGKEKDLWVEYAFAVEEAGDYALTFVLQPDNPAINGKGISIAYEINENGMQHKDVIAKDYMPGVTKDWEEGVLSHAHLVTVKVACKKGENRLKFFGAGSENVLEQILLVREGSTYERSYLGPKESFCRNTNV